MTSRTSSKFTAEIFFCWWGDKILRFPWALLLLTTLLCGLTLHYTINNLGVNTDTSELLSPDLPFQQNRFRWEKAFPHEANTILFVVEGSTPEQSSMAAERLNLLLRQQNNLFEYVEIADLNSFFKRQGLLYLNLQDLENLAVKLIDAQPFIGHLEENLHLQGLLEILGEALENTDNDLQMDLDPILEGVNQSLLSVQAGKTHYLSWQELLAVTAPDENVKYRHIVSARPKVNFNKMVPAEQALHYSRVTADRIQAQLPGVSIRLTGEKALEQEEMETLANDMAKAGTISLLLVCLVLFICLRSAKLVIATFISLIMGLILTAGYAALVVGHLNVLSVAFAVLYIGLGVDFAIHICLRYRECKEHHVSNVEAIKESVQSLGFSLFLCALTTSIGFFAFVPTAYAGVSELGLISGGGMFIGLLVSLTVLPALLKILAVKNPQHLQTAVLPDFICTFPFRHSTSIRITSILIAIAASFLLSKLSFDSDPVNLRNPGSESVLTFKELLNSKTDSPFALTALADNLEDAETLAKKFSQLPTVSSTITLESLVAKNQEEKLAIIEDLNLVLGSNLSRLNRPVEKSDTREALLDFHQQLAIALESGSHNASADVLQTLQGNIQDFLQYTEAGADSELIYENLNESVLSLLPYTLNRLSASLTAFPFTLTDIPEYISKNWRSASGIYKIRIEPEKGLTSSARLHEFVAEVQSVDAAVTGLSVGDIESGRAVVKAFLQAFSTALIIIFLLLLIILKSFKNTMLVIWPLLLAGLLTGAANVLLDNPFNFANIIAMPLLMGMGVDSGIHIMHRLHFELKKGEHLLQTSTARGVFFSSLTTLCSFTSLTFTDHAGIASMGLLLAVGITFTLICTLVVLPAFSGKKVPL